MSAPIHYLVVTYAKENKHTVVADPENKLKSSIKAQCQLDGICKTGEISFRGTQKACHAFVEMQNYTSKYTYTDSDASEAPDESTSIKSIFFYLKI